MNFVLYLFVGLLNTAFGYSLFALFTYFGMHYTLSCLLGTFIGIFFNFKTTGNIVFKNKDNSLILRYLVIYTLNYVLSISLIRFNSSYINNIYLNAALTLPITTTASYLLNKYFTFREITYETH